MSAIAFRFHPARLVAKHLLGLFASSQAAVAVMLHAAWVFLLLAGLLIPDARDASTSASASLGRSLLRALEWIGAMERSGGHYHADMGTVTRALAALTPMIYLGRLLIEHLRRGRAVWSLWRKAMLSMAIAACGYALALAMLPDDAAGLWGVGVIAAVLTGMATFWALLVRKACDALLRMAQPVAEPELR
jgi:hypothetical protein